MAGSKSELYRSDFRRRSKSERFNNRTMYFLKCQNPNVWISDVYCTLHLQKKLLKGTSSMWIKNLAKEKIPSFGELLPGDWEQPPEGLEGGVGHCLVVFWDGSLILGLAWNHQTYQIFAKLIVGLKRENIIWLPYYDNTVMSKIWTRSDFGQSTYVPFPDNAEIWTFC